MSELTFPTAGLSSLHVHSDLLSTPLISVFSASRTMQRLADGEWVVKELLVNPGNHVNPV